MTYHPKKDAPDAFQSISTLTMSPVVQTATRPAYVVLREVHIYLYSVRWREAYSISRCLRSSEKTYNSGVSARVVAS
jgi:hypothetical protein